MKLLTYLKLLAFVLVISNTTTVAAQTVDEIIGKHIAAMGGEQNLSSLKSIKISASVEVMNTRMPVRTIIVQDRGFRTETTLQGKMIIQAIDRDKGWMLNPIAGHTQAVPLPESAVKPLVSQTDLTGLYNYRQKGHTVSLEGEEDLAGTMVYKITVHMRNGVQQTNYLSKDTYYILKVTASVPVNGTNITSENRQSDFRNVDGLTFPFSSEITTSSIPGMKMVNTISQIEVNPKIDDRIFRMPQ
jgi:outer membrane lipoprotein-sorting protein